jgi:hypothetical protein
MQSVSAGEEQRPYPRGLVDREAPAAQELGLRARRRRRSWLGAASSSESAPPPASPCPLVGVVAASATLRMMARILPRRGAVG